MLQLLVGSLITAGAIGGCWVLAVGKIENSGRQVAAGAQLSVVSQQVDTVQIWI